MREKKCPLLKKTCLKNDCEFYAHLIGTNPNTGEPVDEFMCSIKWLPLLLIENSQQTRQAGSAIESFRNEMVKGDQLRQQIASGKMQLLKVN